MAVSKKIKAHATSEIISEILDLTHLCHAESDVKKVLDLLVEKIARITTADVCSLYLVDPQTEQLVLKATKGLNESAVDAVKLHVGEGLVGKTLEWLKPVSMALGKKSKSYKYIPITGEEKFASFLSVPLIHNRQPIGVLVIQNQKSVKYSTEIVHLLMTLAIPAVNVIEKAKLLGTFDHIGHLVEESQKQKVHTQTSQLTDDQFCQGIGASPGIAIAKLKLFQHDQLPIMEPQAQAPLNHEVEQMRLLEAFRWVEEEIFLVQKKAKQKFGMEELSIFDAYQMVLESAPFKDQILEEIDKGKSAYNSVDSVIKKYIQGLSQAEDVYIRERAYDIQDVGRKIMDRLLYGDHIPHRVTHLTHDSILFSPLWSISDFVDLDLDHTKGILSATGGAYSHIAILAESLNIPAVMGLSNVEDQLVEGQTVVMDGSSGMLVLQPSAKTIKAYEKESQIGVKARKRYKRFATKPATPKKGKRIIMGANIGIVAHTKDSLKSGAEEIGLYRSEFPFLMSRRLPTEEELFAHYQKILKAMGKRPVTIRTLDIGGDKYLPYLNLPHEENPSLGWRAIRFSLDRQDLFRIQLRALLRASIYGKLRLLFPMVSSLEEVLQVKEIIKDVKKELTSQKIRVAKSIPLGIMIEVPASVEIADRLAKEVQFFSIGTNDLTQHLLAVDRNNANVAKYYNPLHPSVLSAIKRTLAAGHAAKKSVSVCGEMAALPMGVVLLVGMGIDSLSMASPFISKMKALITQLDTQAVQRLTTRVLKLKTVGDIEKTIQTFFTKNNLSEFLSSTGTSK